MTTSWLPYRLGDLTEWSSGGTPSKSNEAYWRGSIPWISASSMDGNRYSDSKLKISAEGLVNGSKLAEAGSILLLVRGSILHQKIQVGIAERDVAFNQDVKALKPKGEIVDSWFLLTWFMAKRTELLNLVENTGIGAGKLDSKLLQDLEVLVPPESERARIVELAKSIDDKIELNRQMNETLESMAQALFKSWFVDFDPVIDNALAAGNEIPEPLQARAAARQALCDQRKPLPLEIQAQFPSSFVFTDEMGWIPEGWGVSSFGRVSKCFDSKRIPLSKKQRSDKQPGDIPYYGATSIMDYVNEWIFDDIYLLVGEDGSVMREDGSPFVQYIWGRAWVNNHAHVLQGIGGVSTEHLMLFMQSQNIAAYVTGAVQLKINQKNMNSIPFLDAGGTTNQTFAALIANNYERIRFNTDQLITLEKLRDNLLPKLLSGELRVTDAAKKVTEAL